MDLTISTKFNAGESVLFYDQTSHQLKPVTVLGLENVYLTFTEKENYTQQVIYDIYLKDDNGEKSLILPESSLFKDVADFTEGLKL